MVLFRIPHPMGQECSLGEASWAGAPLDFPEERRNRLLTEKWKGESEAHGFQHSNAEMRHFSVTVLKLEIFMASK